MENVSTDRMTFDQYQRLTPDQKELFVFDKLCKIDLICTTLDEGSDKYAGKWVETAAKSVVSALVVGTVGGYFALRQKLGM